MRILITRLASVVVILAWAHVSAAQTADEVIEKSIAAMGGRAAMEKIKTRSMVGDIALTGKEKVGDRDAFVLTFEPSIGTPLKQYIDAESYLPVKTVIRANIPPAGDLEQTAIASDFRDVDGVKVPYKVQITSPATGFTMTFTKISNNVAVDEKLFVKP